MNLEDLLTKPEGKTLEFKRDRSSPDGALRTIVAFANTAERIKHELKVRRKTCRSYVAALLAAAKPALGRLTRAS